jgi:hypothetical protein
MIRRSWSADCAAACIEIGAHVSRTRLNTLAIDAFTPRDLPTEPPRFALSVRTCWFLRPPRGSA